MHDCDAGHDGVNDAEVMDMMGGADAYGIYSSFTAFKINFFIIKITKALALIIFVCYSYTLVQSSIWFRKHTFDFFK